MKYFEYQAGQLIVCTDVPKEIKHLFEKPESANWVTTSLDHDGHYKIMKDLTIEYRDPEIIMHYGELKVSMQALEDKLLSIGGKHFVKPPFEEDLIKILKRGTSPSLKGLYLMKGLDSQCHFNSARCWDENREISQIMTGYALLGGKWVAHSWVLDNRNKIVETTIKRDAYFGFILTTEEADEFYWNNGM